MKTHMKVADTRSVSEFIDPKKNVGTRIIDTPQPPQDSYRTAYDAGYQQGYREGFSDGYKMANPPEEVAATMHLPIDAVKTTADKQGSRLRGLPCVNCGCASFSDETHCPGCGTSKTVTAAEGPQK